MDNSAGPHSRNPPATILIVDDNAVNLQVMVQVLEGQGHKLLVARGGQAALRTARQMRPDLVLMDIMMPEMDGYETTRRLKADPLTRDGAVIFLSALGEVQDKVKGLECGAVDYITKPIQAAEVVARVNTHLTVQRLTRELARNKAMLERELASVADMQRLLLPPRLPQLAGAELAACYQTSRHAGGDYYDVVELPGGRAGILVADVSGHGAPAAVVMAMVRAVFHAYPHCPDDPAAVLMHLNEHFAYLRGRPLFVTALYAVCDPAQGTLTLATAGHPCPIVCPADGGAASQLACDGVFPLLVAPFEQVPLTQVRLGPGGRALFFTDGAFEVFDGAGRMYGVKGLCAAMTRAAALKPAEAVNLIVADLHAFRGNEDPRDDQTLLLLAMSNA